MLLDSAVVHPGGEMPVVGSQSQTQFQSASAIGGGCGLWFTGETTDEEFQIPFPEPAVWRRTVWILRWGIGRKDDDDGCC